jgi:hypothetical protein
MDSMTAQVRVVVAKRRPIRRRTELGRVTRFALLWNQVSQSAEWRQTSRMSSVVGVSQERSVRQMESKVLRKLLGSKLKGFGHQ